MSDKIDENIDINKLCILDDINIAYGQSKTNGYIKSILGRILFREVYLEVSNSLEGIVFFKSESSHRKDHNNSFFKVYESAGSNVVLITVKTRNRISIIRLIHKMTLIVQNIKKIHCNKKKINNLARINTLLIADDFFKSMSFVDVSGISLGVVYYDVSKYDYMFVKFLQAKRIKTATLQHAAFISPRKVSNSNFEFEGVELSNSISDIFLAWNPFTKDEAIKSGMREEKVKILGIPKYIGGTVNESTHDATHCFGVVLNAKSFDGLNRKLIQYADFVAKKTGYNYYLKYHPQFQEFIYDDLPKSGMCLGHFDLSLPVSKYVQLVDFTLISNSTVFIELIFIKHTVIRMQAGEEDKFKDILTNSFGNKEELNILLDNGITTSNDQLFQYMCYTENPQENYEQFFKNIREN